MSWSTRKTKSLSRLTQFSGFVRIMNTLRGFIVLFLLQLSFSTVEVSFVHLCSDFTSLENTGRIRVCNFIMCWGPDDLKIFRKVSYEFRCLIAVKDSSKSIGEWYLPDHLQLFVLDMSCPDSARVLKEASDLNLFTIESIWLIINRITPQRGNQTSISILTDDVAMLTLQELNVNIISQIHVANQLSPNYFRLTGIFKRDFVGPLIREELGYWTLNDGINFTAHKSPAMRRYDMEGREFTGAMVITDSDSLNHMDDMINKHIDNLSKINYVFTNVIISALNATMKYYIADSWGEPRNGTFDGMIGYAQRGEADLVVTPLIMREDRMRVLEYIAMTARTRIKFIFLSPPLSFKNNIYALPFSSGVWYCCAIMFVSSIALLRLTSVYENCEKVTVKGCRLQVVKKESQVDDEETFHNMTRLPNSWSDIILMNIGTLCQQDMVVEPKSVPGRVLILFLKVAVLFLYVSYSAAIVVLLQSTDTSITTLKDLLHSNMKLGAHEIAYNRYFFKTAQDPVRKGIANKVSPKTDFLTVDEGVTRVRSGLYAFYVERTPGYTMVRKLMEEDEKCRLQELDESFIPDIDSIVALRKNCSYSKIWRIMFKRLHEGGHTKRQVPRSFSTRPKCSENTILYTSVGLVDCHAAVVILGCGVIAAVTVLIGELLCKKFTAPRKATRSQNSKSTRIRTCWAINLKRPEHENSSIHFYN